MAKKENKTSKKREVKKREQTKDKCASKETLGRMQKDNKEKISKYLLYVWTDGTYWCELADGTSLGKGKSGGLFEIRLKGFKTPMLVMQYPQGRNGCGLLCKDVKRNRTGGNGQITGRQKKNREGIRPL